jgi:hypothetical protein
VGVRDCVLRHERASCGGVETWPTINGPQPSFTAKMGNRLEPRKAIYLPKLPHLIFQGPEPLDCPALFFSDHWPVQTGIAVEIDVAQ